MQQITVVGGGLAGLTAAITAAEGGAPVHLLEAHDALGGRARSTGAPYKANLGPHAMYKDGPLWAWLRERGLLPPVVSPPLTGIRVRWEGAIRRTPPLGAIPTVLRLRGRKPPVDRSFRDWVLGHADERTASMLCNAAGVYTFHHDPGELSAAFVWPRTVRLFLSPAVAARFPVGGWGSLVKILTRRARALGVQIETGQRVDRLPGAPVIVAGELADARALLDDDTLTWQSGHTLCLDLGLRSQPGDVYIVSDLDEAGWVERYSSPDPSVAPDGEDLVQAQMPIRPGESPEAAAARLERLLDHAFDGWRERETWRRRQVMKARTGALDLPGQTWEERPAIERGDGVFLAGDMVASPGLLAEVAWSSGVTAAQGALAQAGRPGRLSTAASSTALLD